MNAPTVAEMNELRGKVTDLLDQEPERIRVNSRGNVVAYYKNYVMEIPTMTVGVTER